jgi:hypothetical protein
VPVPGGLFRSIGLILLIIALARTELPLRAQTETSATLAQPVDAVEGILEAFKSYDVVALGEGPHGNEAGHWFRLALLRDPRFAATVDDILVEFGSGKYQAVMDRFVGGEGVPYRELQRVWRDTTVAGPTFERPIYEEFFRAVRALNGRLPVGRRVRVLLGDAPIEWDQVKSAADLRRWGIQKDRYAARVVKSEVLGKKRRALIIYGDGHLQGRGFPEASLVNVLERRPMPTRVFNVSSSDADLTKFQATVASWRVPSLAHVRGTVIGVRPYAQFYPLPPRPGWDKVRFEDQFDAVLYLGNRARRVSPLPAAICADAAYMKERLRRLSFDHPAVSQHSIDALKKFCAVAHPSQ